MKCRTLLTLKNENLSTGIVYNIPDTHCPSTTLLFNSHRQQPKNSIQTMSRDLPPKMCVGCHFAHYTGGQKGYAEQKGTPLAQSCQIYCGFRREYVFKDYSCNQFVERHEEIR